MNAIERAIRAAFEKGNPDDRAFRERVYRSAFSALSRSMEASPQLSDEDVARRKELFKETVVQIEQEFVPALAQEPAPRAAAPVAPPPAPQVPAPEPDRRVQPARAPEEDGFGIEVPRRERAVLEERRRPVVLVFSAVTVLALLAIGGWWLSQTLFAPRGEPVPRPAVEFEEEDFAPEPELAGDAGDRLWITVFSPADITRVNAPGGMVAEALEEAGEPVLRIRSTGQGGAVGLEIGQGALERAAGRSAMFAISASAQEGEETQFAVSCDFGALGDCGRRRYIVGEQRGDFLFELALPSARVTGPGRILVNPDAVEGSRALDLFEIRMSISQ